MNCGLGTRLLVICGTVLRSSGSAAAAADDFGSLRVLAPIIDCKTQQVKNVSTRTIILNM